MPQAEYDAIERKLRHVISGVYQEQLERAICKLVIDAERGCDPAGADGRAVAYSSIQCRILS